MSDEQGRPFRPPPDIVLGVAIAISLSLVTNMACSFDIDSAFFVVAFVLSVLGSVIFVSLANETQRTSRESSAAVEKKLLDGHDPGGSGTHTSRGTLPRRNVSGGQLWEIECAHWAPKARLRRVLWMAGWLLVAVALVLLCASRIIAERANGADSLPSANSQVEQTEHVPVESAPSEPALGENAASAAHQHPASSEPDAQSTPLNGKNDARAQPKAASQPEEEQ